MLGDVFTGHGMAFSILLLILSIISSNLAPKRFSFSLFSIALLVNYFYGFIDLYGLLSAYVYLVCCYCFRFNDKSKINIFLGLLLFILTISFFLHLAPGFINPVVIDKVNVSHNAIEFSQYFNIDKAVVAYSLLSFLIARPKPLTYQNYLVSICLLSISFAIGFLLALVGGIVAVDVKIPEYILIWVLVNLFITTYAEEAFFRGFVQKVIFDIIGKWKFGNAATISLSGLLFGLAHFPAGVLYVLIATLLGSVYALIYLRTRNILVPIIAHFAFNLIHFTMFTYPYISEV